MNTPGSSPPPSPAEFDESGSLETRNQIQEEFGVNAEPWFSWLLAQADLPASARLLELGCGSGELWRENASRLSPGWQVVLSDRSLGMVAGAARALSTAPIPFHPVLLEAQAAPFPTAAFDAIFAVGLLDLLPELDQALDEITRLLKPGGQLYATAGGRRHLKELEDLLRPLLGEETSLGGVPERFGLENGLSRLEKHFQQVELRRYPNVMILDQAGPILDYLLSEDAVRERLTGSHLQELRARVEQRLAGGGSLPVTLEKGLFIAR